jgi:hypothetical protein
MRRRLAYADRYGYCDTDSYRYCNSYAYCHTNSNSHAYGNCHSHIYSHHDPLSYSQDHADPEISAYAEAASNATTSTVIVQ